MVILALMKKALLFLISMFAFITSFVRPLDCPCGYLGEANHKRDKVKNRSKVDVPSLDPTPISDILKMKVTTAEKKAIKLDEDKPVDREKKLISVTGYAWIIKLSGEDCDIHIELSADNKKSSKRIIAEIPNTSGYCEFHKQILKDLVSRYNLTAKNEYRFDKKDNGGKPIKMTVAGYLFWDSGHPTNHNHGSNKVGSVWELHPVSSLKWEN